MSSNKALLALVIGMGVVILVGLGVLAFGLMQRAADSSAGRPANPGASSARLAPGPDVTVQIPPGSSVASIERNDDLLMVHVVDEEDRSTLLFIDPFDGRVVRRIVFSSRVPAPPR